MVLINFKCPNCGEEDIKETLSSDFTESLIEAAWVNDEGYIIDLHYGSTNAGGDIHDIEYNCNGCGLALAGDLAELTEYLKEHGMIDLEATI